MSSISIGNFDGVHLGHQALLGHARALAEGGMVTAVSFEPHPMSILRPESAPRRLSSPEQRRNSLLEAGADEVRELEPTHELLGLGAEEFMEKLRGEIDFDLVVEGPDFRFARRRSAGVEELAGIGRRMGFEVAVLEPVSVTLEDQGSTTVCSTLIRWLLEQRRPVDARRALGRPYRLAGTVVRGAERGRTLGYPTANLDVAGMQLPGDGVYAGMAILPEGKRVPAAVSVGTNPTFGGRRRTCEAHLLDHDGEIGAYGWSLEIDLLEFLRDQLLCEDVDALLQLMERDCDHTRRIAMESNAG